LNQCMRRLEFRRRLGGCDADVRKSHRGQRAWCAPGDGLRFRVGGNSAGLHSTVATTAGGEHAGKLREGRRQSRRQRAGHRMGGGRRNHAFLPQGASHMAAQGPAKPVHIRATRDPAVMKRMGDLLVMHTISEAQELSRARPIFIRIGCDNLGFRRANAPSLSGIAQYHSTHSVAGRASRSGSGFPARLARKDCCLMTALVRYKGRACA
jgi:hypothetical protein